MHSSKMGLGFTADPEATLLGTLLAATSELQDINEECKRLLDNPSLNMFDENQDWDYLEKILEIAHKKYAPLVFSLSILNVKKFQPYQKRAYIEFCRELTSFYYNDLTYLDKLISSNLYRRTLLFNNKKKSDEKNQTQIIASPKVALWFAERPYAKVFECYREILETNDASVPLMNNFHDLIVKWQSLYSNWQDRGSVPIDENALPVVPMIAGQPVDFSWRREKEKKEEALFREKQQNRAQKAALQEKLNQKLKEEKLSEKEKKQIEEEIEKLSKSIANNPACGDASILEMHFVRKPISTKNQELHAKKEALKRKLEEEKGLSDEEKKQLKNEMQKLSQNIADNCKAERKRQYSGKGAFVGEFKQGNPLEEKDSLDPTQEYLATPSFKQIDAEQRRRIQEGVAEEKAALAQRAKEQAEKKEEKPVLGKRPRSGFESGLDEPKAKKPMLKKDRKEQDSEDDGQSLKAVLSQILLDEEGNSVDLEESMNIEDLCNLPQEDARRALRALGNFANRILKISEDQVTYAQMKLPIILPNGDVIDRSTILEHKKKSKKGAPLLHPFTNEPLSDKDISTPCKPLIDIIKAYGNETEENIYDEAFKNKSKEAFSAPEAKPARRSETILLAPYPDEINLYSLKSLLKKCKETLKNFKLKINIEAHNRGYANISIDGVVSFDKRKAPRHATKIEVIWDVLMRVNGITVERLNALTSMTHEAFAKYLGVKSQNEISERIKNQRNARLAKEQAASEGLGLGAGSGSALFEESDEEESLSLLSPARSISRSAAAPAPISRASSLGAGAGSGSGSGGAGSGSGSGAAASFGSGFGSRAAAGAGSGAGSGSAGSGSGSGAGSAATGLGLFSGGAASAASSAASASSAAPSESKRAPAASGSGLGLYELDHSSNQGSYGSFFSNSGSAGAAGAASAQSQSAQAAASSFSSGFPFEPMSLSMDCLEDDELSKAIGESLNSYFK